jgi:hypothetical protein
VYSTWRPWTSAGADELAVSYDDPEAAASFVHIVAQKP